MKGDHQVSDGKKPSKKREQPAEEIEESAIISDEPEADASEDKTPETDNVVEPQEDAEGEDAPVSQDAPTPEPDVTEPEESIEAEGAEDESVEEEPASAEAESEPALVPVAPLPPEQVIVKKGGFVPLFLGGIVAAGIGFGLARYVIPDWPAGSTNTAQAVENALAAPKKDIADLSARLEALEGGPDLSGVTGQMDEMRQTLTARIDGMGTQLADLEAQVEDLASRPNMAGSATEAVAAYEAQMEKLRAEVAAMTADAQAQKAAAEMTEREAMLRNSLTRVRIALDEGTPFADDLANIQAAGMSVPDGLSAIAQSGAPTLAQLQEDFPAAARDALSAARKGGAGSTAGGIMNRIFGVRSLEPREGNDPDAILSRAEAALKEARLSDTLAEIDALPEAAKAELADWTAGATQRTAALAAADALAQELNKD